MLPPQLHAQAHAAAEQNAVAAEECAGVGCEGWRQPSAAFQAFQVLMMSHQ